ncbi:MAG TPA: trigger factor [Gemmataceae bacterium]|nr:trigger factor [Gemmataceae bacterium]
MADETRPEAEEPGTAATITEPAVEDASQESDQAEDQGEKLQQSVEMNNIGPCKKHVKVTVDRSSIDTLMDKKFSELVVDTPVAGFRPGKAPRKIIERRFRKDVAEEVRAQVLLRSLGQLEDDNKLAVLAPPNLDPGRIEIPEQGPLVYEFDVEVRPEFDLPNYKGLKLRRPVRTFTDADVEEEERRILAPYGSLVPKPEGNAESGDYLVVDMTARDGDHVLSSHKEITMRVDPQLALKDGVCENFGEAVKGAHAGETRTFSIKLSDAAATETLRGKTVQAVLDIKEVKKLRLPELTPAFLQEFGVHSEEQLRERIRVLLERRLEYHQRQSAREQVLEQLAGAINWELPQDILQRQARKSLHRRIMEMQNAGMNEDEIRGRLRLLQQDVLRSTAKSLQEHFVLQKIAEVENIDIDEDDLDDEIDRLAAQSNESPRRVRARLEKEDLMDVLATEIIERAALDLILDSAEYEDVPLGKMDRAVATVEEQAVPGQMHDPTEAPPEAKEPEVEPEKSAAEEKPTETKT